MAKMQRERCSGQSSTILKASEGKDDQGAEEAGKLGRNSLPR